MTVHDSPSALLYGTSTADPDCQAFELSDMDLVWQEGAIRRLSYRGVEIIRGISAVLRDDNWGTYRPIPVASRHRCDKNRLTLEHAFQIRQGNDPRGSCWLEGVLTSAITYRNIDVTLTLHALSDFKTCRSGLATLLPIQGVAGTPVTVIHSDGIREAGHFPDRISPSQPFFAIHSLQYAPAPKITVKLELAGDVFEMEDQRNWSDASFKIYNRPLAWPTPYVLEEDQRIEQRLTVHVDADADGGKNG